MSLFGSYSFLGLLGTRSKKNCKNIAPISTVLKRPAFPTATQRKISSTAPNCQPSKENTQAGPEVVTENSVLNSFPRPNLMPTLHPSLFDSSHTKKASSKCSNCSGPHSTDFCPC
ncbi:hypothetical protein BY458DRAFT_511730 [Sporodiniella umbellata]|nr:hypothetical protein BY458DRAFT_511730 [Sporodiniella umbellata]